MFHAPLIIMSRKYFFVFQSSQLPFDIRFWTRGFPLEMRSWKPGLPFATRARKRELSIQEVRIENDSDRKFSKSKFFKVFLKTTFLHDSCYPDHLEPKIFFRSSSKIFEVKFVSNKIKVFLETTFVHVSCYSDHYELKIFFRFSKSATTLRYTNLDSRFPP